jgi:hypothetical protein
MKALKTIVATAVIVFAATTVAMAGVQRLGGTDDGAVQTHPATAAPVAQPAAPGGITLSARQFTALMKAVRNGGDAYGDRDRSRTHDRDRARTHAGERIQAHAAGGDASGATSTKTRHSTTHDTTSHHASVHNGTHNGGRDGGCD